MRRIADLDPTEILEWMRFSFVVDTERGSLRWRRPPNYNSQLMGLEAGTPNTTTAGKQYWTIGHDGSPIKRGWLMFLWVHGRWPNPCLDHINGNSSDDRASNLREATIMQNAWNHKKHAKKSSLPTGVYKKKGRFVAQIRGSKLRINLGSFRSVRQARIAYLAKRRELFGEFA